MKRIKIAPGGPEFSRMVHVNARREQPLVTNQIEFHRLRPEPINAGNLLPALLPQSRPILVEAVLEGRRR